MKFKIGDKVRVKEKEKIHRNYREREDLEDYFGRTLTISRVFYTSIISSSPVYNAEETGDKKWYEDMIDPIKRKTDAEVMRDIIEERNSKPLKSVQSFPEQLEGSAIEPNHYKNGDRDLFDEWHDRYYHSDKTYTGREVFIEIMKSVAERYARRYPNKNPEDISKAIYTLERLKEYEENTK